MQDLQARRTGKRERSNFASLGLLAVEAADLRLELFDLLLQHDDHGFLVVELLLAGAQLGLERVDHILKCLLAHFFLHSSRISECSSSRFFCSASERAPSTLSDSLLAWVCSFTTSIAWKSWSMRTDTRSLWESKRPAIRCPKTNIRTPTTTAIAKRAGVWESPLTTVVATLPLPGGLAIKASPRRRGARPARRTDPGPEVCDER